MDEPDRREQWNANAAAWTELSRAGFDVYRDLINTPAFFDLLPPVTGCRSLDLGCGEGYNTRRLGQRGAEVVGLDIAERLVEAAAADDPHGRYLVGDAARLPFPGSTFDVVTACMSLMDVADPEGTLTEVARVLRPDGFVQFSIVHPATTTPTRRWIDDQLGVHQALVVADYFEEGSFTEQWTFSAAPHSIPSPHRPFTITHARRTLAGWLNAVADAGLAVEAVAEPRADEQTAAEHPEVADTRIVPYFLIVRARKI